MSTVHVSNLETAPLKLLTPETRGTHRMLLQGAEDVSTLDVIRFDIRTRQQGLYHLHERTDNVMLVLTGTLEMVVDGKRYVLHENDMIYIPRGVAHSSASGWEGSVQGIEIYAPVRGTDSVPVELPAEIRDAGPVASR